ncbi:hypothetical protein KW783_00385 [Candidatus Parcubacteria bacterium]|nr:hypothetical protein [Candidatus Parcubacteria bacterium]
METETDVSLPKEVYGIARVKCENIAERQIIVDRLLTKITGRVETDRGVINCDIAVTTVVDTSDELSFLKGKRFNRINWPHSPLLVVWEREESKDVPEEKRWLERMLNSEEERALLKLLTAY